MTVRGSCELEDHWTEKWILGEMDDRNERGPDLVAPPPLIYAGPWLAGALLDRLLPLPHLPRGMRLLGLLPLAAGIALGGSFIAAMYRGGTPIDPREAPTTLVTAGPFAYTRNPGYLSLALAYLGGSLLADTRWPLVFLPAVLLTIDRGVIRREERYLEKRFGSTYLEYLDRVRRWL
jgi:protein-S-isoprenylcysteine O-methyltransferase Ste14